MRRALRFRFDREAATFVARHGILRLLLAIYTGVSPSQLTFSYGSLENPLSMNALMNALLIPGSSFLKFELREAKSRVQQSFLTKTCALKREITFASAGSSQVIQFEEVSCIV